MQKPPSHAVTSDLLHSGEPLVVREAGLTHRCSAMPGNLAVHRHPALRFHTAGRGLVEQNGQWQLDEGDILLVPAGQPHRAHDSVDMRYWGLAFCVPCFALEEAALLGSFERVRDGGAPVVRIESSRRTYLESLFRELETLNRAAWPLGETRSAMQRSLLTLILAEVERAAGPHEARSSKSGVVTDALRFIERNCLRPLTLRDVADAVGRSPAHVTSMLTRATGRSAGAWILTGRMAEARRLLAQSDELIDVIGERVGYADATHFIRMFRRTHGLTPAAWRLAYAKEGSNSPLANPRPRTPS